VNRRPILKAVIVGGVAGGASCAARLRRLDEHAEIIMVERGPLVSYANCGLPYHVGGVIENEGSLIVSDEQLFRDVFNIDVRTSCEAVGISPKEKTVTLRDVKSGKENTESYDKLVLSPGAASVRPPLPGIDLPGIFHVRTVPDARQIREWIERGSPFLAGMNRYSGFQTVRPKTRAVVGKRRRTWFIAGSKSPFSRGLIRYYRISIKSTPAWWRPTLRSTASGWRSTTA
jgi:NADPH-dependent 2,4-dienoyl-CoA reductase/sulfur reductase-like enzyme